MNLGGGAELCSSSTGMPCSICADALELGAVRLFDGPEHDRARSDQDGCEREREDATGMI
ncbi:hypothetical protein WMF39_45695 [Sorangium sp. So ce1504]|uniref:hypothetical protein n=1 Tax=Sorangium sp. So ce1504 TaxID=3133337 RepID=UPI003F643819